MSSFMSLFVVVVVVFLFLFPPATLLLHVFQKRDHAPVHLKPWVRNWNLLYFYTMLVVAALGALICLGFIIHFYNLNCDLDDETDRRKIFFFWSSLLGLSGIFIANSVIHLSYLGWTVSSDPVPLPPTSWKTRWIQIVDILWESILVFLTAYLIKWIISPDSSDS